MKRGIVLFLSSSLALFAASCSEGDDTLSCGSLPSAYAGDWNVSETCDNGVFAYRLTISDDSSGKITLHNLGDDATGAVFTATLGGVSGFDLVPRVVRGALATGNGSLNEGCSQLVIQWSGWKGSCTASGVK